MKIKIAIQDSFVPQEYTSKLVDACIELGMDFECFGMLPGFQDLRAITGIILDDKDNLIIPFGSTKLIKLWLKNVFPKNWKIFYDKKGYEFSTQKDAITTLNTDLHSYLLNADCDILRFPECAMCGYSQNVFIKPANDLKLFSGQILPAGKSLFSLLEEQNVDKNIYNLTDWVVYSSVKNIKEEYRCFVVDDKVSTCLYRYQGKTIQMDTDFITKMNLVKLVTLYNPAGGNSPFVVDVALVEESKNNLVYKILEYNAFQCSGFYNIDAKQILKHTVDYVKENYVQKRKNL